MNEPKERRKKKEEQYAQASKWTSQSSSHKARKIETAKAKKKEEKTKKRERRMEWKRRTKTTPGRLNVWNEWKTACVYNSVIVLLEVWVHVYEYMYPNVKIGWHMYVEEWEMESQLPESLARFHCRASVRMCRGYETGTLWKLLHVICYVHGSSTHSLTFGIERKEGKRVE